MTFLVSVLIFAILALIAIVHLYWAFGGVWPARDRYSLGRTVVGSKGIERMPGAGITCVVAAVVFCAGVLPFLLIYGMRGVLPDLYVRLVIWVIATVFLLRGISSYCGPFRRRFCEEPFVRFDRGYYAPLCLLVGSALTWLGAGF